MTLTEYIDLKLHLDIQYYLINLNSFPFYRTQKSRENTVCIVKLQKGRLNMVWNLPEGFFVKEAKNKAKQDCFAVAIAIS